MERFNVILFANIRKYWQIREKWGEKKDWKEICIGQTPEYMRKRNKENWKSHWVFHVDVMRCTHTHMWIKDLLWAVGLYRLFCMLWIYQENISKLFKNQVERLKTQIEFNDSEVLEMNVGRRKGVKGQGKTSSIEVSIRHFKLYSWFEWFCVSFFFFVREFGYL